MIPLKIEECEPAPTLSPLAVIDFCKTEDFALNFQKLLEVLDRPQKAFAKTIDEDPDGPEDWPEFHKSKINERHFREEIAEIYRLLDYGVTDDLEIAGQKVGYLVVQDAVGAPARKIIAECSYDRVTSELSERILSKKRAIMTASSAYSWPSLLCRLFPLKCERNWKTSKIYSAGGFLS